ncbi:MAG TPA: MOFRL family protein [Allosphingosinicella sp.]
MKGAGIGGPNQEYALALALALKGTPGIHALAADTDGIDGRSRAAGAFIDPSTLARARSLGLDADRALADNDSGGFFEKLGDLFVTGPTGTNVNDLRILLVAP